MASIQIRDVDPALIERLKRAATRERRTVGQQILYLLERSVPHEPLAPTCENVAAALREFWARHEPVAPGDLVLPPRDADRRRADVVQSILDG